MVAGRAGPATGSTSVVVGCVSARRHIMAGKNNIVVLSFIIIIFVCFPRQRHIGRDYSLNGESMRTGD